MALDRLKLNASYIRTLGVRGLRYPLTHVQKPRLLYSNQDKDVVLEQVKNDLLSKPAWMCWIKGQYSDYRIVVLTTDEELIVTVLALKDKPGKHDIKALAIHYGVSGEFHFNLRNGEISAIKARGSDGYYDPEEPLLVCKMASRNHHFYSEMALS